MRSCWWSSALTDAALATLADDLEELVSVPKQLDHHVTPAQERR